MQLKLFAKIDPRLPAAAVVIGLYEGDKELPAPVKQLEGSLGAGAARLLLAKDFKLGEGEWRELSMPDAKVSRLFVLGLGKRQKLTGEKVRKHAGNSQKRMDAHKISQYANLVAACMADGDTPVAAGRVYRNAAEAIVLAAYQYRGGKTDKPGKRVETAHLLVPKTFVADARRGETAASGGCFARDLVNAPANMMTPAILADAIKKRARDVGLRCEVWNKSRIEKEGMGLLLGVAQGSAEEPRFIVLQHGKPVKGRGPVVFVGKGITFDSGGISIKPSSNMEQMKYDMSGAAAVAGAMLNVARLAMPGHFVGLIAAAENLPSGTATKPGDVHLGLAGKSVEIINTDAEGRLVLADALAYAKTFKPTAVYDMATLTGACVIALGGTIGLMGNSQNVIQAAKDAAEATGELVWELPMFDDYAEGLKSQVADMKNVSGGRGAGTITAAKFLEKFTDYPWAHLDIAGAAWEDKEHPYRPKGATGVGARLFTEIAERWT